MVMAKWVCCVGKWVKNNPSLSPLDCKQVLYGKSVSCEPIMVFWKVHDGPPYVSRVGFDGLMAWTQQTYIQSLRYLRHRFYCKHCRWHTMATGAE